MYLVEVVYGMENYQSERKEFDFTEKDKACEYYNEWAKKKPIKISMYQLLKEESNFY